MKKFIYILTIFILTISSSIAIEDTEVELETTEKTLKEKLSDIYHLEIEQIEKPSFLLKEILTTHHKEDSIWDTTQIWGAYGGDIGMYLYEDGPTTNHYEYSFINAGIDGKLKNNIADYRIMLNYNPLSSRNFTQNLFADMYIATNKIPHHRFMVGNTRPPVGMEGGYSPYTLPFVARSQISRNFGTVRKLGARVHGDYSLVDYDFGVYSSDTYFQEFFPGTEFIGWVNFKPLGKTNEKYGKLTLGGGLQSGNRESTYSVVGLYAGYEYKKWLLNFEWANADGYNGPLGHSIDKHAGGFYSTLAYRITPKLQALIRYDEFDPNKNIANNNIREYSAGINYFIKGQALKLIFNYIFCENNASKDSHRLLFGTQILL